MNSKPLISISLAAGLAFAPASAFASEDGTSISASTDMVSTLLADSAAESLGFDSGTIAEELTAEVQLAIDNGVIAPELVEFVAQADEETQIKNAYTDNVSAAAEQWKAEEAAWLEAESEVVASAPLECAEDPNCKTEMGKTMSAIAAEGLLAQVQARVDEALALPEAERGAALLDLGEDIRKMRARLQSALSGISGQDDDSEESSMEDEDTNKLRALLERRGIAATNVTDIDADIMERLEKGLTGDDGILEDDYERSLGGYSAMDLLVELREERRELLGEIEEERRELLQERRESREDAVEERRESREDAVEERRESREDAVEERRESREDAVEERREAVEDTDDDDSDED